MIPARGGSKGIPHKNIIPFKGKPLIAWIIEASLGSSFVDRTILSSDDSEIIEVAKRFGCDVPFVRPASLAADQSGSLEVVQHAISEIEGYDVIVLL
ncbi:MAG: acylneuraminate cytidylyltransferase family protein, partial [Proteobacteria bacterium]